MDPCRDLSDWPDDLEVLNTEYIEVVSSMEFEPDAIGMVWSPTDRCSVSLSSELWTKIYHPECSDQRMREGHAGEVGLGVSCGQVVETPEM